MNTFRDPAANHYVTFPYEGQEGEGDSTGDHVYGYSKRLATVSSGSAGKYSPVNLERAARSGAPLPGPVPPVADTIAATSRG